jgi:EmrB/QacA subfamily drug resistance transporter
VPAQQASPIVGPEAIVAEPDAAELDCRSAGTCDVALDSPRGRWVLAAGTLGSMLVMLDGTVVNVALPRIGSHLHSDFAGMQWVLTGYLLTLASFILLGGVLGDRAGRRRVFVVGVVWFAASSALCGVAPDIGVLVAARVLQGMGGALLTPSSLAIIQTVFRREDRARAIGAWSGLTGIAGALGPFLGGWIVGSFSWRWIFLINLPLAAAVVALTLRHVPQLLPTDQPGSLRALVAHLDPLGALLGVVGLAGTTYGLIRQSWAFGLTGAVVFALFVLWERGTREPVLPLGIFRSSQFSAVNLVTLGLYGALNILMFVLVLALQNGLGYSPLTAGAATVPITVLMLAGSARAGDLAQRIGPRWPMTAGTLLVAGGMWMLVRLEPGQSWLAGVLPAMLVVGLGLTLTVAPLTATAMATVAPDHVGIGSGVNNAVARGAGLVAIAVVPLIGGFDPNRPVTKAALIAGMHRCMLASAVVCAIFAVFAAVTIRSDALISSPA